MRERTFTHINGREVHHSIFKVEHSNIQRTFNEGTLIYNLSATTGK